jgi:hypothetical protein
MSGDSQRERFWFYDVVGMCVFLCEKWKKRERSLRSFVNLLLVFLQSFTLSFVLKPFIVVLYQPGFRILSSLWQMSFIRKGFILKNDFYRLDKKLFIFRLQISFLSSCCFFNVQRKSFNLLIGTFYNFEELTFIEQIFHSFI